MRPGDRFGDRYQLLEPLAAGGMGTLWRARHLELEVDIVLKVVSDAAASPGALKRFRREAQAAAKLRSPNIVQMLDYGEFEGQPYLTMELLRGEDLSDRLQRVGKLSCEASATILDAVAKAVELAHEAGIVHRDLKPANLFLERVGEEEVVKILDFGVAKDLAVASEPASTTAAGVVGSPAYMSPEQTWGQSVGPRSDLWAMGVLAFEMLTGKSPFADETLARIFERIVRDPLPKVSAFDRSLPPTLDGFFERALARSPDERFGSAKELARAFRAAIEQRALTGLGKSRRRPPWIGALLVVAVVAGLMVAALKPEEPSPRAERTAASARPPAPSPSHEAPSEGSVNRPSALAPSAPAKASSQPGSRQLAPRRTGKPPRPASSSATRPPELDPKFGIPLAQ
jgi:serine/threonine protein kinase